MNNDTERAIAEYVAKVVAEAPPLTSIQKDRIAGLLRVPEPFATVEPDDMAALRAVTEAGK